MNKTITKNLKSILLNPFPPRESSHKELLREKSDKWIDEQYSSLPQPFIKMMRRLDGASWAAHSWPDASLSLLTSFTRALLWGIAQDDYYAPFKKEELSKVTHRTMEIARGAIPEHGENPILHQFSIFMREFEAIATKEWVERYVYDISQYLEGIEIDSSISYRKDINYPSIKEYIPIRRKNVAMATVNDKIELVTGILPNYIVVHPFVQQARILAGDLFAWSNDLISLEKEMQDDEGLNLVLVIQNERSCSIEDAFDEAVQMYNSRMEEFMVLYNDIPDFGVYTPVVKKFLEGQGLWISGYLNWFEETNRYQTAN
ncbi:terpene synthase family protein [Chryseobacterium sp. ISL-6]|uniref:terpene synthase family protein n=1 Tax=Chryseobacterium sp. ISL-6 TaxID=2819143 RepID=UPI001BE5396F|nr:terpene synthase family protein [Chryseobacterium sp. ISL-6]MBT2620297.1 hypothetical protein [Chryseobacterium sp. ISL-6]